MADTILPFDTTILGEASSASAAETNYANAKGLYITFNSMLSAGRVDFKAFVTTYHDNFSSDWASDSPYGRIDSVHTFSRTSRVINLGFSAVAYSQNEAKENLAKVSALIKMLYPSYENRAFGSAASGSMFEPPTEATTADNRFCLSAPPLLTVKFANLIKTIRPEDVSLGADLGDTFLEGTMRGVIAAVENFSVNPRVDVGFFDGEAGWLYPKVIDLAIQFVVLHQVSPTIVGDDFQAKTTKTYGDLYGAGYAPKSGTTADPVWEDTPAATISAARAALQAAGKDQPLGIDPEPSGPTTAPIQGSDSGPTGTYAPGQGAIGTGAGDTELLVPHDTDPVSE